ncbi:MAG: hypothetical protein ACR2P7_04360, partial [bacterium]
FPPPPLPSSPPKSNTAFALLDIHSARFRAGPISVRARLRNFRNILRYDEDRAALNDHGLAQFFGAYLHGSGLSDRRRARLLRELQRTRAFPELARTLRDL